MRHARLQNAFLQHEALTAAVQSPMAMCAPHKGTKCILQRKALTAVVYSTCCAARMTTEVYPDSPRVTEDECNRAQVAAVRAALDHILEHDDTMPRR